VVFSGIVPQEDQWGILAHATPRFLTARAHKASCAMPQRYLAPMLQAFMLVSGVSQGTSGLWPVYLARVGGGPAFASSGISPGG